MKFEALKGAFRKTDPRTLAVFLGAMYAFAWGIMILVGVAAVFFVLTVIAPVLFAPAFLTALGSLGPFWNLVYLFGLMGVLVSPVLLVYSGIMGVYEGIKTATGKPKPQAGPPVVPSPPMEKT